MLDQVSNSLIYQVYLRSQSADLSRSSIAKRLSLSSLECSVANNSSLSSSCPRLRLSLSLRHSGQSSMAAAPQSFGAELILADFSFSREPIVEGLPVLPPALLISRIATAANIDGNSPLPILVITSVSVEKVSELMLVAGEG